MQWRRGATLASLLTVLGLGLVAGTVPLWLGEALFCDDSELYCGLGWLVIGHLGLVIAGGICGWLGRGLPGLAAGLVGVGIGTLIALALESEERQPYLPLTWELFSGWVLWAIAAFGIGYGFVWAVVASARVGRRRAMDNADARPAAAGDAEAEDEDA